MEKLCNNKGMDQKKFGLSSNLISCHWSLNCRNSQHAYAKVCVTHKSSPIHQSLYSQFALTKHAQQQNGLCYSSESYCARCTHKNRIQFEVGERRRKVWKGPKMVNSDGEVAEFGSDSGRCVHSVVAARLQETPLILTAVDLQHIAGKSRPTRYLCR